MGEVHYPMKNIVLTVFFVVAATLLFAWSKSTEHLPFGVYDFGGPLMVIDYAHQSITSTSDGEPSVEKLLSFSAENPGQPAFIVQENFKRCEFAVTNMPAYRFIIPKGHEYRENGVLYRRLQAKEPFKKMARYNDLNFEIEASKGNKVLSKFTFDERIGIREFVIFDSAGNQSIHAYLTGGEGMLSNCTILNRYFPTIELWWH
jgi:hypothetical protein